MNTKKRPQSNKRGLYLDIILDEFKQSVSNRFTYCGASRATPRHTGLDRKNNNIGYTFHNSIACCLRHNWIKCLKLLLPARY